MSDAGVDGFSETVVAPTVDCKINDTADVKLDDLRNFKDGTLLFETDTGKVYSLNNAWIAEPPKLTKGEWELKYQAQECLEG